MKKVRVAVTGMNAVDSPGPGVAVLRCLQDYGSDLELIGLSYDVLEPGNFMGDLIHSSFILPYPSAGPEALRERLLEIHRERSIDIILPTLDSELENYIDLQTFLEVEGIRVILPNRSALRLRDKTRLEESLGGAHANIPRTIVLGDLAALDKAIEELEFPFLVKGVYYDAHLVHSQAQAQGYFHKLASQWGLPVIAQQWIDGEEQNVAALAEQGSLLGAVAMKKMFLTDKGKAWSGVTIANPAIMEESARILDSIHWDGACELEYIVEKKTNKVYLIEINPRFPAWIYLSKAAGLNLPLLALRQALGEPVAAQSTYQSGVVFVRHSWDEIVPMEAIASLSARGALTPRALEATV
ncbi:MAG: ATP-grasp domain-containing protein [Leptospiraceae bacterium]|nr:ATP-grasp domain-containing protein [Leptospiraceae bacterium]